MVETTNAAPSGAEATASEYPALRPSSQRMNLPTCAEKALDLSSGLKVRRNAMWSAIHCLTHTSDSAVNGLENRPV